MAKTVLCIAVLAFLPLLVAGGVRGAERIEYGIASVYWPNDGGQAGTLTASGIPLDRNALTAAHRDLPFGTRVRVTVCTRSRRECAGGKSVIVTVNDRGPYRAGRVIDLTPAGERALGFSGLAPVRLEVLP